MDAKELRDCLTEALERESPVERIQDFGDAGIWSSAEGILIQMSNGELFLVSVVQTRHAPRSDAIPTTALCARR